MKQNNILKTLYAAVASLALAACSDSFDAGQVSGEGRLILKASVSTDLKVPSRAVADDEAQALAENCLIWISRGESLVRQYKGIDEVPAGGVWLVNGTYTAEAWAGDSVPASWDKRYFKGIEEFNITSGSTTQVTLQCAIANAAVSVSYADGIDDVLKNYTLTVGHLCGSLTWEGRDDRRGYFMMNSRAKALEYTLTGTTQTGETYTLNGTIDNVKGGTLYALNVKYNATEIEVGGGMFTIEIDETTIDVVEDILIVAAPTVKGVYQSLDLPVYGEVGNVERQSVYVSGATALNSVTVRLPAELLDYLGTSGTGFDLLYINEDLVNTLHEKGLTFTRNTDEAADNDNIKINFEPELLGKLPEGEYDIDIEAVDRNNKTGKGSLKVIISNAAVSVDAADPGAVMATSASLTGSVMKDGCENPGIEYRVQGHGDWQFAPAEAVSRTVWSKNDTFKVTLTGLQPGTTYEYRAKSDEFIGTALTFTTEEARQLPNCGFENWSMSGKTVLVKGDQEDMFWDSGNHGSSTMGKNITDKATDLKHSGEYSIRMESQFVGVASIGAFAAGNVFIGQFLGTENTTKGILGWGREWNTRPAKLRGYVKYTPAAVTYTSRSDVKKGDMDKGIIYIALVDDSKMTYNGYTWPQVVATKNIDQYSFKKDGDNVIAYGEMIWSEATPGSDLVPFEITLDYKKANVKPSNIILTASASIYGDYYTGGPSVMYLDDLELVY